MVPTYNRPDLARACVLQLIAQSRPPDLLCVHQNGNPESYHWSVADIRSPAKIAWVHTPGKIEQHQWYAVPLRHLLEQGCTHVFWADHDDIYLYDHIAQGLADLQEADFSVSSRCGILFTRPADFRYQPQVEFTSHAPGGMSSTMCFNRRFGEELLADIGRDTGHQYTDNIVAHVTMPKFRCIRSQRHTCIYHSHEGTVSSKEWLEQAFE